MSGDPYARYRPPIVVDKRTHTLRGWGDRRAKEDSQRSLNEMDLPDPFESIDGPR